MELVRYARNGFGQLSVKLCPGVYGLGAQKKLRRVAEEPQEFLAAGGTRIILTNRIMAALLKMSFGARDYKQPEEVALLASDCPKAKVELISATAPAKGGKLEPRRPYPKTLEYFEKEARNQVGIMSDWLASGLRQGFEQMLERLISMHARKFAKGQYNPAKTCECAT